MVPMTVEISITMSARYRLNRYDPKNLSDCTKAMTQRSERPCGGKVR